jgi:hypothetical protein
MKKIIFIFVFLFVASNVFASWDSFKKASPDTNLNVATPADTNFHDTSADTNMHDASADTNFHDTSADTNKSLASISLATFSTDGYCGDIYYVSKLNGDDANSGLDKNNAFETIGAGISALSAGDALLVGKGTYTETGLDLNVSQTEVWFELGVILNPASGNVFVVSGNYCRVVARDGALRVNNDAGANTGVVVSGNWNYLAEIRVACASVGDIGFDITGDGNDLRRCRCSAPLTASFKIQGDKNKLEKCCTGGEIANTSNGYWITNSCDKARLIDCGSQGHSTAGFQFDSGCTNIVARNCDSGGGDGHFIDNASNTFMGIDDKDSRQFHEHVYPTPDGEGTSGDAVIVQSEINDETGATTTEDYFGDVAVLVPVATITTDWFYKGVNVFAETALDDQRFRTYRVEYDVSASRNGGNAWDEGATVLTFDDASAFAVNDLIWIDSPNYAKTDGADGEIVKITNIASNVVTIARQTESSGRTGLHWDHSTNDGGNEVAYLCWRDESEYHSTDFDCSAASAKDYYHINFVHQRRMHANDGLICRMINGTDGNNSQAGLTIIWAD